MKGHADDLIHCFIDSLIHALSHESHDGYHGVTRVVSCMLSRDAGTHRPH